jgi:hypothetical protein
MNGDGFTLGEYAIISAAGWRGQVGALAAELAPLETEQRNARWSAIVGPFITRQRAAGITEERIAETVNALASLVAAEVVRLERADG